ncbi:hypothetical protein BA3_0018 [Thalassomonas phage BA3]|uniref:HNH endonuclease n=1 Tax=Thalassomonas phage BA3 TaxID=469660 RepID=UPI00015D9597|nr:HNH endonuclease [Thalassomonas phage BA3]ABV74303.1 hypothetical protein BA3_0018 [Thalassomonas phage BA3]
MINQDRLKELLTYNPEAGLFTWKVTRGKAVKGNIAGSKSLAGYIYISIENRRYLAHRLALIYVTGGCSGNIDHIDGVRNNNIYSNLRIANPQENSRNCSRSKSNKSGCTGVSFDDVNNKWRATIKVNRKQIHLGRFSSIDCAIEARKEAEVKYGFHKNHGRAL